MYENVLQEKNLHTLKWDDLSPWDILKAAFPQFQGAFAHIISMFIFFHTFSKCYTTRLSRNTLQSVFKWRGIPLNVLYNRENFHLLIFSGRSQPFILSLVLCLSGPCPTLNPAHPPGHIPRPIPAPHCPNSLELTSENEL